MDALQPFVANGQVHVLKKHNRTLVDEMCSMTVEKGKVIGRSPNLADSFAYHPIFWRSQEVLREDEEEGDIVKYWGEEPVVAYGLEVLT